MRAGDGSSSWMRPGFIDPRRRFGVFRKSDELVGVMKRLMVAIQSGDTATARGLIANQRETLLVATSGEWLYGVEAYEVISAQLSVSSEYDRTFHNVEAYENGSVGWGAAASTVTFPNGRAVPTRTTAVFHLDGGVWRVVQWHSSTPATDADEWVEEDLPRSLNELVGSLDSDLDEMLGALVDTSEVALVISDIEDSSGRGVQFGDALWSGVVQRHFDHLERVTAAQDGTVVKTMGDGALIAFDTAVDAARAAIAIQQSVSGQETVADYRVRVGVHVGQVVHQDDDYFGYTVNKTARLASAARGGEILVSESVASAITSADEFSVGEPRVIDLKGLPGTHRAYPLGGS